MRDESDLSARVRILLLTEQTVFDDASKCQLPTWLRCYGVRKREKHRHTKLKSTFGKSLTCNRTRGTERCRNRQWNGVCKVLIIRLRAVSTWQSLGVLAKVCLLGSAKQFRKDERYLSSH